jgi:hypothetical protein
MFVAFMSLHILFLVVESSLYFILTVEIIQSLNYVWIKFDFLFVNVLKNKKGLSFLIAVLGPKPWAA